MAALAVADLHANEATPGACSWTMVAMSTTARMRHFILLHPGAHAQGLPAGVGYPTTIDRQRNAVHEAALLGIREERDRCRHILRLGKTRHRNAVDYILLRVGATALVGSVHFGFDPAWTDRVNPHAAPAPLCGECLRESDQTVLGRTVGTAVADPCEARHRCDIDDTASAPLQHLGAQILAQQKRPSRLTLITFCH